MKEQDEYRNQSTYFYIAILSPYFFLILIIDTFSEEQEVYL